MGKTPRVFDVEFKKMAVDLSYSKGKITSAASELGIEATLLGKWRRDPRFNDRYGREAAIVSTAGDLEQENRQLRKVLREMTMERDILKKAVGIFSKGDRNDSVL